MSVNKQAMELIRHNGLAGCRFAARLVGHARTSELFAEHIRRTAEEAGMTVPDKGTINMVIAGLQKQWVLNDW